METTIAASIERKLDLNRDQINAMFSSAPVAGWIGTEVAADLARRFGLNVAEPLGVQLAANGVLTDAEAAWLDDAD